jgi:hypothetical protein
MELKQNFLSYEFRWYKIVSREQDVICCFSLLLAGKQKEPKGVAFTEWEKANFVWSARKLFEGWLLAVVYEGAVVGSEVFDKIVDVAG